MTEHLNQESAAYRQVKASLDAWEMWADLTEEQRLKIILDQFPSESWYHDDPRTEDNLSTIVHFWGDGIRRGAIKQRFKNIGGNPFDLEKAVEAYGQSHRNGEAELADDEDESGFDPFVFTDAASILAKPSLPRRWLIPGLIADGLTLLGGSPKSGKSYLSYALALAVAKYGTWCNHWAVEQGKVIYAALEDDETDSHDILEELMPGLKLPPGRLIFVHGENALPAFNEGALEWIEHTLKMHKPRLMIIDPISYLYVLKKSGSQFEETKDMLFPLRWLGKKYGCAIVCPDHRRKRSREDVSAFETLYGSVAKQAVADGLIMVDRDDTEITMEAKIRRGKDQRNYLSFTFDNGRCFLNYKAGGDDKTASYSDLRMKVHTILREAHVPLTVPEILANLELPDTKQTRNIVYQVLFRSQKSREIDKTNRGMYVWSQHE
jgi:AAA domain